MPKPQEPGTTETTNIKIEAVLECLMAGNSISKACKHVGLSRDAYYEWLSRSPENKELALKAKTAASDLVEDALFKSATESGSNTAQIFWLKNRRPDEWKDRIEQKQEIDFHGDPKEMMAELKKKIKDLGIE